MDTFHPSSVAFDDHDHHEEEKEAKDFVEKGLY